MKKSNLILMFIVLGVLMSSFAIAGLGDVFENILDIGSLKFLFGAAADNQLIGFIRIAIAVLVFSLLYMGLSLIPGMSKNIAITVGIVLAIITAVFLPASLLIMIGGTYSTIFALLIIGAPLVGIGWLLFKTPTSSRGAAALKFFGVVFMIWLVNEISHWATAVSGGAATMLVDFSEFVSTFSDWANIILVIVLVYFGWKMFTGGKAKEMAGWGAGKGKELREWGGKKLERRARRQKTRLLSQFIEEEKGLKDIDKIEKSLDEAEETIESVYANKELKSAKEKKELVNKCNSVEKDINETIREFRIIKRVTWRENTKLDGLLKELKGKGVDVSGIEALENNILKLHEETKVILEKVRDSYVRKTKQPIEAIKNENYPKKNYPLSFSGMPIEPVSKKPTLVFRTGKILAVIKSIRAGVESSRKKQEEVIKEVQGIMVKTRDLWK